MLCNPEGQYVPIFQPGEWNDEKIYHEFWSPEIRVLERKNEIIGYFCVSIVGEKTWLQELQIVPWMQGRGIGRKVMSFLESEAMDNGSTVMALCVLKDNPARAFYAKLGYFVVDKDEGDLTQGQKPIFIMEKRLRDS
jgi:ribosomal protein S18 acetylase RimI-like enzyme